MATEGFVYQMQGSSLFTKIIDFADGFDNDFEVWAAGQSLGLFGEDDMVDFVALLGQGVSTFAVTNISPLVDGNDPLAFPIQLEFDTPTATFAQYALTPANATPPPPPNGPGVPEPTTLAMFTLAMCFMARRTDADRLR